MTKFKHLFVGVTVVLGSWVTAAQAQLTTSFVSSTGSGSTCTRTAPCGGFSAAAVVTNSGGQINCLDSGPYSGFTLTKSLTIDCAGTAAAVNAITMSGTGLVVKIRNLVINGSNIGGIAGLVDFTGGGALFIENCLIENAVNGVGTSGIHFAPQISGARLFVTDTKITNSGTGATGGGIVIKPQSTGTAQVALDRLTVVNNVFGIAADGSNSTAGINMTISDSMIGGNSQDGVIAVTPSGGAPIGLYIKNTKSVNNAIGVRSIGPSVTVRVDGSSVIGNSTGLSFSGGGALLTAGNNMVRANGSDGAFSGPVALQ